jgi:hypothetical protein
MCHCECSVKSHVKIYKRSVRNLVRIWNALSLSILCFFVFFVWKQIESASIARRDKIQSNASYGGAQPTPPPPQTTLPSPQVVDEARPNNAIPNLFTQVILGGLGSVKLVDSSGASSHSLELLPAEFVPGCSPIVSQTCPNGAFHLSTVPLL